ncbi:hypothetical protein UlMin_043178 [Ulmus minor]
MEEQSSQVSVSPSFNSYSSDRLADIADRVSDEFRNLDLEGSSEPVDQLQLREDGENDDDFEFVSLYRAGKEVFLNGRIGPVFPVFNRDLLGEDRGFDRRPEEEDSNGLPSSSSSESDELDTVPAGTYCVWAPKRPVPESPGRCRKSKSTGSSLKRWRSLKDLLKRSNSEGKESYVFLTPSSSSSKVEKLGANKGSDHDHKVAGKVVKQTPAPVKRKENMAAAHEVFYVKNKMVNQKGEKRRSYLPYRRDLVGFFANVNNLGRTFPPF